MLRINKILFALLLFTIFQAVAAESTIDVSSLTKVTAENNPKCVEYYQYQGETYCSTKPLSPTQVDPNIKNYEKLKIVFDQRPWQIAWGQQTPDITTIEYIPMGDNINQWRELVTSQFFPDLHKKLTPHDFAHRIVAQLRRHGFNPVVHLVQETPDRLLFEFRIKAPENMQQDEIQMIIQNKNGLYVLHYATRQSDMGVTNREKWIELLNKAQPLNT